MDPFRRTSYVMSPMEEDRDRFGEHGVVAKRRGFEEKKPVESHEEWIALVRLEDGTIQMRSSAGMKRYRDEVLRDAAGKFSSICKARDKQRSRTHPSKESQIAARPAPPSWQANMPPHMQENASVCLTKINSKRRRLENLPSVQASSDFNPRLPSLNHPMVQNGSSQALSLDLIPGEQQTGRAMITIRVDQKDVFKGWLQNAFRAIQQQSCRLIAKEWIKTIHPKKQSTHPYNGNMPRRDGVAGNPSKTKPPYWPANVRHKEPDHIDKEARTELLVHLLMGTPHEEILSNNADGSQVPKEIRADDLLATLTKTKKEELKHKWDIIVAVIDARAKFESFEEGGMDASTEIHVINYQDPTVHTRRPRARRATATVALITDGSNEDNDSRGATPIPPDSPTESPTTTTESSNDDDLSAMNVSFTSTMTTQSSRPPRQKALRKNEPPPQDYPIACAASLQQPRNFDVDLYGDVSYVPHGSTQSMVQEAWLPTSEVDISVGNTYPRGFSTLHEATHHGNHTNYPMPNNTLMETPSQSMPYSEPQSYPWFTHDGIIRDLVDPANVEYIDHFPTPYYQLQPQPRQLQHTRP